MATDTSSRPVATLALYDDTDTLLAAAARVRDAGYRAWDCHTPYPVHGLDEAMGLRPSRVPTITLTAGALGLIAAVALQGGVAAFQYPTNIGGKPLFAWPAWVPIMFELFVLFAALANMACIIVLGRLGRWHSPLHDAGVAHHVSADRFCIVLSARDDRYEPAAAARLLSEAGGREVRVLHEETEVAA